MIRRHQGILLLVSVLLLLFFLVGFIFPAFLANYLESTLLPRVFEKAGIHYHTGEVRHLGFTGADLIDLSFGGDDKPSVFIASIRLDYTPTGLIKKHIDKIVVSGLELDCEIKEGKVVVRGLNNSQSAGSLMPRSSPGRDLGGSFQFPVSVGKFSIMQSVLIFNLAGQRFRVPVETDISSLTPTENQVGQAGLECKLTLQPRGQMVQIFSTVDIVKNKVSIKLLSDSLQLERFSDLAHFVPDLSLSGAASLEGDFEVGLNPLTMVKAQIICELHNSAIGYKGIQLQNQQRGRRQELPIRMIIVGKGEEYRLTLADIESVAPMPLQFVSIENDFKIAEGAVKSAGDFQLDIKPFHNRQSGLQVTEELHAKGSFTARLDGAGEWNFSLATEADLQTGSSKNNLHLKLRSVDIGTRRPVLKISGEGKKSKSNVGYMLKVPEVKAVFADTTLTTPLAMLNGSVDAEDSLSSDFELHLADVRLARGTTRIKGDFKIEGVAQGETVKPGEGIFLGVRGVVRLADFTAEDEPQKIKARGISGEIPFQWPFSGRGEDGTFTVENIARDGKELGSLTATFYQQEAGAVFKGTYRNDLLADSRLDFAGEANYSALRGLNGGLDFVVPRANISRLDFGDYLPPLTGIVVDGAFECKGDVWVGAGIVKSALQIKLYDARLEYEEKGFSIEGLNVSLAIPDLFKMRSDPQQRLTFTKVSLGKLTAANGKLEFQVESPQTVLIEKSEFEWAQGRIYTPAFRITAGKHEYEFSVFCDRLKLANLLEQFGVDDAEGEGTVNGLIPLAFSDGGLRFGNGFLYSTPGEEGTIRVREADVLTAGIPKNTPQFAQVDFALAALRSFNYKWVKVEMDTEEEDLVLRMKFDGMPEKPLPFKYNKNIGQFVRIDAKTTQGIYQPIRLDVNFRLPLNRILDYSKTMGRIIDKAR